MITKCSEVAKKVFGDISLVSPSEGQSNKTSLAGSLSQASTRVLELRARLAELKPESHSHVWAFLFLWLLKFLLKGWLRFI